MQCGSCRPVAEQIIRRDPEDCRYLQHHGERGRTATRFEIVDVGVRGELKLVGQLGLGQATLETKISEFFSKLMRHTLPVGSQLTHKHQCGILLLSLIP